MPPTSHAHHLRRTTLLAIALGALVCNLYLPQQFSDVENVAAFMLAVALGGAAVAQICLLAIWAALGAQPATLRVPMTVSLLTLGICSYLVGLQRAEVLDPEVVVVFTGFSVLLFGVVQLPLWIARARSPELESPPDWARESRPSGSGSATCWG